jgi:PhoPQ-activated pathogenicity-related protein
MVVTALFQIPDEHITFSSDPIQKSRSEDAIIAFTWDHFLKDPSNPEWLVRFPMVKASLRAMDATKEYMQFKYPEKATSLDYFNVAGASKRGWTTWLVGAVDPTRVMTIIPIVLDAINFTAVEHHQFRSYGAWSFALEDYTDMNITERFDDPNMVTLQQNVDPYFYKERLTMPKFVVNAGMDEFQ